MKHPDSVVMIFSKAPVAGEVKTRLVPHLSFEQAARLHAELTQDRLRTCTMAGLCDVQLWCSPDTRHPFFADCRKQFDIEIQTQKGDDLGERMSNAIETMLNRYRKIIIIGSDAPALDASAIDAAITALDSNDIVLVPAEDGGYVLIGAATHREGLLAGVPWGTENVLVDTVRNVRRLGLDYRLHGECWDVDRPEDLLRYQALKM